MTKLLLISSLAPDVMVRLFKVLVVAGVAKFKDAAPWTSSEFSRSSGVLSAAAGPTSVSPPERIGPGEAPTSKSFRPEPLNKVVPLTNPKKVARLPLLTRNSLPLLLVTLFQNVVVDPPLMITFDPLPLVTEP